MANQPALKNYYTFAKGLVTESSPLLATENACVAMSNVLIGRDGSLASRPALAALSTAMVIEGVDALGSHFSYAVAQSIVGDTPGSTRLALSLGGSKVYVFDIEDPEVPTLVASIAMPTTDHFYSLSSGRGYFCATAEDQDPILISKETGAYAISSITLFERDHIGIVDGYPDNFRPIVLTDEHHYNLLNQGWDDANINTMAYPSNSDTKWAGVYTVPATGLDAFSAAQITGIGESVGLAPKGHIVRSVFDQANFGTYLNYGPISCLNLSTTGTSVSFEVFNDWTGAPYGPTNTGYIVGDTVTIAGLGLQYRALNDKSNWEDLSGIHTITAISYSAATDRTTISFAITLSETYLWTWAWTGDARITSEDAAIYNPQAMVETARPRCSVFYAGRLWYSGIQPITNYRLQSTVYFSQTLDTMANAGKCLSVGDPTARANNEVVDTDGGYVVVSDMGTVHQMLVVGGDLVLLAENGVWSVSGKDGIFSPTAYAVRRLSTRGVTSPHSACTADGTAIFYSNKAVYMLTQDKITGFLTAEPISDPISSYLTSLPAYVDDDLVHLSFDAHNKRVYICFGIDKTNYGTGVVTTLVLDMLHGAFEPLAFDGEYTDANNYCGVAGVIALPFGYTTDTSVIFPVLKNTAGVYTVQFFSMSNEAAITDAHIDGVEYESYFTTCATPLDTALMVKQMPRLGVYMEQRTGSSLKVQGRYSWSGDGNSGKWGTKQECYKEKGTSFDVCHRTLTVRGEGKAVQLHFTNDASAPFKIYGWDIKYTGNPE